MGAYDRIQVQGHTLNRRTAAYFAQVQVIYALIGGTGSVLLAQGSYNGGAGAVSASGGTHDGGGALDSEPSIDTPENWAKLERAHRICGGASWDRPRLFINGKLVWNHHNHTIVIGDQEMSDAARKQVQDYYAFLNGLANHAHDGDWRPSVIPVFVNVVSNVDLSNVRAEALKTRGWNSLSGVKQIQRALNLKTGTHLPVDGTYGPRTKAAYARYEKQAGGDGNGVPGVFSLTLLGAARFNVVA